jgi:hypothetical protein
MTHFVSETLLALVLVASAAACSGGALISLRLSELAA